MNRFKLLIFFIALSIFFSSSMGQPKKKEPEDPTKIFDDAIEALDVSAFEEVLKKGADPNARPVFWVKGGDYFGVQVEPGWWHGPSVAMLVLYRLGEIREFKPGIGNDSQLEPQEVYKRVLAMLKLLVDYGADFETSTAGKAPLMQPVMHGNVEIAKFLVEHGANPNEGQRKGPYNQPVYLAFLKWDLDVGRYLQTVAKNPVKPWLVDGLSLLNHAYAGRTDEVQEILARAQKPRRSALANFKAPTGETLLLNLIYGSWRADDPIALVRSVLEAGADPNQSGKTENDADIAPLHYAVLKCDTSFLDIEYRINSEFVIKDNLELVALLLEHGANVSSTNCRNLRDYDDNITPLHIAAKLGRVKVARLLIESGAKIMPKDSEGKTPLDLAESGPMIKFLKENGAVEGT